MCDLAVDLDAEVCAQKNAAQADGAAWFRAMPPGDMQPTGFADELAAIDRLSRMGIVQRDEGRICVSEAGRPFVRLIAAAFDAYLLKDQKRHSLAV